MHRPFRRQLDRWLSMGIAAGALAIVLLLVNPVSAARSNLNTPGVPSSNSVVSSTLGGIPTWAGYNGSAVHRGSVFVFEMYLNAVIPRHPSLFGNKLIDWSFGIDTNRSTAPTGWPAAPNSQGGPNSAEYLVQLWWDGVRFAAGVANRTPLLTGGNVTITAVPFTITNNLRASTITFWVSPRLLGNASSFGFGAYWEAEGSAVVTIHSRNMITPGPGNDTFFAGNQNSPFPGPWGAHRHPQCAYIDHNVLPAEDLNCWAVWPASTGPHTWVLAGGSPAWADVDQLTLSKAKQFRLTWVMGANVPTHPSLLGSKLLLWFFFLDNTNGTSNASGWPFPHSFPLAPYFVIVAWDGHQFAAAVVNATATASGGNDTLTPLHASITGRDVSVLIPAARIGDSSYYLINGGLALDSPSVLSINSSGAIVPLRGNGDFGLLGEGPFEPSCATPYTFDSCIGSWP